MTSAPPPQGVAPLFRAEPLPRWRAVLAVVGFATALLSAGGMLEYGSGSPAVEGTPVATYWTLVFALYTLAFGGMALLAAFPRLSRPRLKLIWVTGLAAVYALAFRIWYQQQTGDGGTLQAWTARSAAYIPAALAVLVGLAMSSRPGTDDVKGDER
jgi:hypothetical protein